MDDVMALNGLPVQYAGFVLAPSKRKVTIKELCQLVTRLHASVTPVAVFVNPTENDIKDVVEKAGVKTIQLHGEESVRACGAWRKKYGVRIIKALLAASDQTIRRIEKYGSVADVILVDTFQKDVRGGTGKTFEWEDIPRYKEMCRQLNVPLWIAGGLNPDNVQTLITRYAPDGVDVSSGIEINGKKCAKKMKQFVERVRNC